ncbi:biopolymer transporter ExbB [Desulforhopalus sp. 52FAK]
MQLIELLLNNWFQFHEHMQTGGIVMWPLLLLSLVMWILIVDRLLFVWRLNRKGMDCTNGWQHIQEGRLPDPKEYRGAIPELVALFITAQSGSRQVDKYILDQTVIRLQRSFTDRLTLIGVLAAIAPLLGLLGTVIGMITTFDVLAIFGTGNAKAMAGGISEALITTQTGLLIAIPGLFMKGFLDRKAGKLGKKIAVAGLYFRQQL